MLDDELEIWIKTPGTPSCIVEDASIDAICSNDMDEDKKAFCLHISGDIF
jgi:hypothetical protein